MGAADFFEWFAEQSPVDVGSPTATTIAGHDALVIDGVVPDGAFENCAGGYFRMVNVGVEPRGDLSLPRYGQRFRLAALQVEVRTVLLLAFAEDGAFSDHIAAVEVLLGSLDFVD